MSDSKDQIQNHCPVDGHPLVAVPVSTQSEIEAQVSLARAAQPQWESLGLKGRAKLMRQAGKLMLARRQEAMELIHDEAGKTPAEMLLSEVVGPLQYMNDWVKVAAPFLKKKKVAISPLAFPKKQAYVEQIPRGVVGIISPWNYPIGNFFKPVFAALLSGNSVVLKPSEYAPQTAQWFVDRLNEFLPKGVITTVHGRGEQGQALVNAGIDAVTFTGSYRSGRLVAEAAARNMIPISVELGGKDCAIVLEDCELDRTVAGIMHWALHNAGQACGAIERVYVEEPIADRFVEKLGRAVAALQVSGDTRSSDIGAMVTDAQLSIVDDHVQDAIRSGAKLICGGKPAQKGRWYLPTVLDHCENHLKIMQEPTFGPVITVTRVPNGDAAIPLANRCEYGLNGSVWSRNLKRATALGKRLEVGTVFVNNHAFTGAVPAAPWTGVKKTGYGVANSTFALGHYTRPRTVVIDRKRSADGWWFPMVDPNAEEMGHCLAEAQLGNIPKAIKIPFLMAKRQKTAIRFVKDAPSIRDHEPPTQGPPRQHDEVDPSSPKRSQRSLVQTVTSALLHFVKTFRIPLLPFELRWGVAAIEGIYSGAEEQGLVPVEADEAREFLKDIHKSFPFPAHAGIRANFWIMGLAPILVQGKLTTIDRLSPLERGALIDRMEQSNSYHIRQISLLMKVAGSFPHISTIRFRHTVLEKYRSEHPDAPRPQDPPGLPFPKKPWSPRTSGMEL